MPWHTEYFKLKKFEKWQVQEGLSDIFPLSPSLIIRPSYERCLPRPKGKDSPYFWRLRKAGRNGNEQTLLSPPSLSHLAHLLLSYHIFPWHTSSSLALEYSGFTASSHLHFLRKTPTWHSTWICIFFFLVISFVTDPQQEPKRVEEKIFFLPMVIRISILM